MVPILETVRHLLRRHLTAAMLIALVSAAVTLSGALLLRVLGDDLETRFKQYASADLRTQQERLASRMDRIEEEGERVRDVIRRLEEAGVIGPASERTTSDPVGAPFAFESVVTAIVQLVCIDPKDDRVYYTASGTVVGTAGLILTNSHTLRAEDGSLITYCGVGMTTALDQPPIIEYIARTAAYDDAVDLAVLEITERLGSGEMPERFAAIDVDAPQGGFTTPALGETVYIGGYPGIGADTFTFTQGVVSGQVGDRLIKTSALIDSGTSGGAAFDTRGRYLGVATAAVAGDIGGSLGYLVSAKTVDAFLTEYFAGTASGAADPI